MLAYGPIQFRPCGDLPRQFHIKQELLEAKQAVDYRELEARSYITRCSSTRMPFHWTIAGEGEERGFLEANMKPVPPRRRPCW